MKDVHSVNRESAIVFLSLCLEEDQEKGYPLESSRNESSKLEEGIRVRYQWKI